MNHTISNTGITNELWSISKYKRYVIQSVYTVNNTIFLTRSKSVYRLQEEYPAPTVAVIWNQRGSGVQQTYASLCYWRHWKAQDVHISPWGECILSLKSSVIAASAWESWSCPVPSSVWLCLQKRASATGKSELNSALFRVTVLNHASVLLGLLDVLGKCKWGMEFIWPKRWHLHCGCICWS